jgi:hypothetical protein
MSYLVSLLPHYRCVQCYSYSIDEVETGRYTCVEVSPTIDDCKETLGGELYARLYTYFNNHQTIFQYFCQTLQPKQIKEPIFEKRCKVDPTPFHSNCISPNETVFVLKTPTANGTYEYPANIVCYWNTPALGATQQLYVDTLRMDVEGNPSESCPDKLIIESDNQDYNRVACGTADMPVLFNELIDNKLKPIFLSNAVTQETGVELLMVYLGEDTTSTTKEDVGSACVDLMAPPETDNAIYPPCRCKPVNISDLCPNASLAANPYYQKYLSVYGNIPFNAAYGFRGYKGCLGAEFFRCDGFVESLTEEECRTFTLGMTPAEADQFLTDGASLWNILTVEPTRTHPFCQDSVSSTRPNAMELVQIQDLVLRPSQDKAEACCTSLNKVLKEVAKYLKTEPTVPILC